MMIFENENIKNQYQLCDFTDQNLINGAQNTDIYQNKYCYQ